jgi:hypothetical protein
MESFNSDRYILNLEGCYKQKTHPWIGDNADGAQLDIFISAKDGENWALGT